MEAAGAGAATDSDGFKVPNIIPQDILLIQDLVGHAIPSTQTVSPPTVDMIDPLDSSDENTDSTDEVELNLISVVEESTRDDISDSASESSTSSSHSSSSSDSDSESELTKLVHRKVEDKDEEDDEQGGAHATAESFRTKNELSEPDIMVPSIVQVGPEEQLEKVGEIMNIVNNVVIVKGHESGTHRASDRALDCETLLVYEDRRVLGHIYETFGPTYQPMYQVKFNNSFPLDVSEAWVSRPVFHVPARSKYIFVPELAKLRGSDASNVHDEEPADHEVEFSDDEAEAMHRATLKDRRHASRGPSVPASPAHVRDQDMDVSYGCNPYAEHGVYDMDPDYGAGPSRPTPQPYDDPYSDAYNQPEVNVGPATSLSASPPRHSRGPGRAVRQSEDGSGQGPHGQRMHYHNERGRGRGRGRERDRGRGRGRARGRGGAHGQEGHSLPHRTEGVHGPRSLSPTSTMIAQATGQYGVASEYAPLSPQLRQFGFAQPYSPMQQQFISPQQAVQPHINPRFVANFGLDLETMQQQQQQQPGQRYLAYNQYGIPSTPGFEGGWGGQWSQVYVDGEHRPVDRDQGHDHNSSGT